MRFTDNFQMSYLARTRAKVVASTTPGPRKLATGALTSECLSAQCPSSAQCPPILKIFTYRRDNPLRHHHTRLSTTKTVTTMPYTQSTIRVPTYTGPRPPKKAYESVETRIQEAITVLKKRGEDNPNIAAAAREFNLPRRRLSRRWQGQNSKQTRQPTNRKLNEAQELALCLYLDRLDEIGTAARLPMVTSAANTILRQLRVRSSVS